ncbi:MAG: TolC family protein [Polyangiaceae bacterium]
MAPSAQSPQGNPLPQGNSPATERPKQSRVAGPGLDRARLIREVLAKNPSIEARRHAFRASRARERQVDTWADPMLGYEVAPLSIFSSNVQFGQTIRLSQRVPWPGKLSSARDAAEHSAAGAREAITVTELDLALEASNLFDDYWGIERALDVNREHRKLLDELRRGAEIQYSVGRGSLSEPLQVDVETAMLTERDIGLEAARDVVIARLNALLHRRPESPLPAPSASLAISFEAPPTAAEAQRRAIANSPELKALAARSRAAQAEIRFAERQYYPDLTLMASYSSMWKELEHQFMVGVEAPIPIQRGARGGAVDAASAKAAQVRSETTSEIDRVRAAVEITRRRVIEALRVAKVYDQQVIPSARDQVAAVRADFGAGKVDFSNVVQAEKSLRAVELNRYRALTELSKRRAELSRAMGIAPGARRPGGGR